ncbi:lasso peptide biosynthesis B2 protein [Crocosphaera sp.]|uniref:lasso peptide biosynthesis B2 protein n=1 Tax=Crocosphaera sp. TaxID=2729996 RepID=UPI00260D1813|nr:lasso peptide biosynthesis B2 protein [Crocosphaera sp.]MDJ0582890.1 lasso peptide biosynthesis B2 protein [Crocosphaera sp.]
MFKKIKNKNTNDTYQLNQDVILYNQEGFVQLLDFNQGQFYALDRMATVMLSSVLDRGLEATITNLSQVYDTTEEEIGKDLTELLDNLIQKKLLTNTTINKSKSQLILQSFKNLILKILHKIISLTRPLINPQPEPNFITIHLLLILIWLSFRCLGWSETIKIWKTWYENYVENTIDSETIKTLDDKLKIASASNPLLSIMCKERALVGYHLLRSFYQVSATLIIGVTNDPFEVHAWVEYEGIVLTDDPVHCQQFKPVMKYQ